MNIILFESAEKTQTLPTSDARAKHILKVLKCQVGNTFHAGVINGSSGQGTLVKMGDKELTIQFTWINEPEPPSQIHLIIGLPRPQTARKILNTLSTLGAQTLNFVQSDKSDRNYTTSKLWHTNEWTRHLIDGAQQGFTTAIPEVSWDLSLYKTIKTISSDMTKIALDNYEGITSFGRTNLNLPLTLAIGPEQGWSNRDRELLTRHGFHLTHLGQRVLRVETACVSAIAIAKSKLGLM